MALIGIIGINPVYTQCVINKKEYSININKKQNKRIEKNNNKAQALKWCSITYEQTVQLKFGNV